jgi:Lysyl oxidase
MHRFFPVFMLALGGQFALQPGVRTANAQVNYLYPDMFPYVDANAPSNLRTLQAWQLSGTTLSFPTLFANQGDGLFEIRRGNDVSATRYELLQRVYIGTDFGSQYVDLSIGTAPKPNTSETSGLPYPTRTNVIWFEDFTKFSLLEAPIVNGVVTVGNEVASTVKTSWSLTPGVHLPGYGSTDPQTSDNQAIQQRLSVGYGDLYSASTPLQSINISGVPIGPRYWLRQTVDPENRIHETDETNNSFEILIDLAHPGEAITFAGQFVQPGDRAPAQPGDLNEDGVIDINDWLAFKAGAETSLAGLGNADAYVLGDLDLDGVHSLHDVALFRQYFDGANGAGAFAGVQNVPEPPFLILGGVAMFLLVTWSGVGRRVRRQCLRLILFFAVGWAAPREAAANVSLFSENFDGLTLGPNVDETLAYANAWTDVPPAGWVVDDSGVPFVADDTRGVAEWEGWSFANKDWWVAAAGDQLRSEFALGQGTVAVADPDEWDDKGSPINGTPFAGYYNALFKTPSISLAGATPGTVKLAFSSSWRHECCDDGPAPQTNDQTARIRVSYDNGASFSEVLRWESNPSSAYFKNDATNEAVAVNLNNPVGASNAIIEFGLLNAGNDWWWAIDNVQVFTPTVLEVNTTTGKMMILGASQLTGYEITSAASSLNAPGWKAGNLDAQNFGPAVPLSADFNNSNSVDAADYILWRKSVGAGSGGDADGDGDTDSDDYNIWRQQFSDSVAAGQSWESLIGTNQQLLEFFLLGNSTFASHSIGGGYNTAIDARDLTFKYSMADGQEYAGIVRYVSGAGVGSSAVPEPAAWAMLVVGMIATSFSRRPAAA